MNNITEMDDDNMTNFSCRSNHSLLSSSDLTDRGFWQISSEQEIGATVAGVLILIFFLVGTIWNLFIIVTYLVKHRLLKEPGNILLFNAAITDMLICITTMIFSFVTAFGKEFVFGNSDLSRCAMCKTSGFFLMFLILVSLHLLCALSVDRFILLSKPLHYKGIVNRGRIMVVCFVIYSICFVLAVLPMVGFGEVEFNARFASCVPRFTPSRNLYYVVVIAVEALIPIFILAITNVWTFRIVQKFLKRNYRRRSTYRKRGSENARDIDESVKYRRQQNQLVKVFGALFIANIVSYTPTITTIFVFAFLSIIGKDSIIPSEVYILGFVSFLMNPVLHPIIESFFVKDLRYQVNRAGQGIRRMSTILYRQTTQILNTDLDEANRRMDELEKMQANGSQANSHTCVALSRPNGKAAVNAMASCDTDMPTETESLPNSLSGSPQHDVTEIQNSSDLANTMKGGVAMAGRKHDTESEKSAGGKEDRMLGKVGRSVTFQETSFNDILTPKMTPTTPPASRSLAFQSINPVILEERSEEDDEDSLSVACPSSRSPLPV